MSIMFNSLLTQNPLIRGNPSDKWGDLSPSRKSESRDEEVNSDAIEHGEPRRRRDRRERPYEQRA
jgi:hypothetical protein